MARKPWELRSLLGFLPIAIAFGLGSCASEDSAADRGAANESGSGSGGNTALTSGHTTGGSGPIGSSASSGGTGTTATSGSSASGGNDRGTTGAAVTGTVSGGNDGSTGAASTSTTGGGATTGSATTGSATTGSSNGKTTGSTTSSSTGSATGSTRGTSSTGDAGAATTATTGGGTTGATTGSAGVTVSASCKIPTWPTPTGSTVNISGTKSVSGVYDGNMALHEGDLEDCSSGNQSSVDPIIEVADGGTVKNVIFGKKIGDGIHCLGSCTIDNVWYQYVCDDAVTMLGGSGKTATIRNSGFKGARDKTIQHNGNGSTVVLDNIYVETAGKLYRSCGDGCSSSEKRTVTASNIVAIGVSEVVGVSTNDKATLSNICAYRTPTLCKTYQPGSDNESTAGANGTSEGPSSACSYKGADSHALVDRVAGSLQSDVLCTGPNSVKDGSTNATACVAGFETCQRPCAPGGYGFKQDSCVSGVYKSSGALKCAMPSDPTIAGYLSGPAHAATATTTVTNNSACTTEWAWGIDGTGKYCVCVTKPGYYQESSGWYVWDCQSQWW